MKRGSYWNLHLNPNHGDSSFMMALSTQFEHQTSLLSVGKFMAIANPKMMNMEASLLEAPARPVMRLIYTPN